MDVQDGGAVGAEDTGTETQRPARASSRRRAGAHTRGGLALIALGLLLAARAPAQSPGEVREDQAVGDSVNYVFATDLGSGVYELDGRSLQIYRYTYRRELRETRDDQAGLRFTLPLTAGFFDFSPLDVISSGPPTRVDSLSLVPGLELDYLLDDGWHLIPYVRGGFSLASSSVDGWLYGAGLRIERRVEQGDWDALLRTDIAYAGVRYRDDAPPDEFLRFRQGFDFTRAFGRELRKHRLELGVYGFFDYVADPPTAPLANGTEAPAQAEFGITLATRPRLKIWRFDAPRVGIGYRIAGELSAWRLVLGVPF
jgi:hypothetical protein